MNRMILRAPLGALLCMCATPALADHAGASAFGGGGGFTIFGPATIPLGQWAAGFRLAYTRPEQRSDDVLGALAGQHIHAHNTDYNLNGSLGIAYGLTDRLTISAEIPYLRRDGLRQGEHSHGAGGAHNEVVQLGSVAGIADVNLLAKYRVAGSGETGVAIVGGIKLPTGSTAERSREGERLETEHQPGSGSWDPMFGASASTLLGPMQLTASALYHVSTRGAQHTRLGNRLQGGIALSHRFGPAPHEHAAPHEHSEAHDHETRGHQEHAEHGHASWDAFVEPGGEWEGRQQVDGEVEQASGGKWAWVAPGVRFNSASRWTVAAAVAVPIWQRIRASHPDNKYRLLLSVGRSF